MKQKTKLKRLFLELIAIIILSSMFVASSSAGDQVTVEIVSTEAGEWVSGFGWVGSVNILVDGEPYVEYCIEYDEYIYIGETYTATLIPLEDTPENRAISYILSWYEGNTDQEAYAIQVAIWKYATGNWMPDDPPRPRALEIYNDAYGRNVARPGDVLTLSPASASVKPGSSQVLTAKLVDANGQPRKNVKILFYTDLGTLSSNVGFTDDNGEVKVELYCDEEGVANVQAVTNAYWAYELDLGDKQNLIPIGCPIEASTLIAVGKITFVIPEVPLGTATVTVLSLFACTALKTKKLRK